MQSKTTTPPVRPASAEDVRAVNDALGDLYHLLQGGAAGDESPRALERYQRAIAAATQLAASDVKTRKLLKRWSAWYLFDYLAGPAGCPSPRTCRFCAGQIATEPPIEDTLAIEKALGLRQDGVETAARRAPNADPGVSPLAGIHDARDVAEPALGTLAGDELVQVAQDVAKDRNEKLQNAVGPVLDRVEALESAGLTKRVVAEIPGTLVDEPGAVGAGLAATVGPRLQQGDAALRVAEVALAPRPMTGLEHEPPKENGAPQGEHGQYPEARPSAGALERAGGTCGERGIRTPDTLAGTPDFESGASSSDGNGSGEEGSDDDGDPPLTTRAVRLAALAWDFVDRDPQLAARVAFDLVELDEHDPVACIAECCNSPLALEVRS